jgi:hypothetical protein
MLGGAGPGGGGGKGFVTTFRHNCDRRFWIGVAQLMFSALGHCHCALALETSPVPHGAKLTLCEVSSCTRQSIPPALPPGALSQRSDESFRHHAIFCPDGLMPAWSQLQAFTVPAASFQVSRHNEPHLFPALTTLSVAVSFHHLVVLALQACRFMECAVSSALPSTSNSASASSVTPNAYFVSILMVTQAIWPPPAPTRSTRPAKTQQWST